MSWELQRHMHQYVAPSVEKAALERDDPDEWLCQVYADQRWHEGLAQTMMARLTSQARSMIRRGLRSLLIEEISNKAIEYGSTTNGAHEVYLDDHGYTSIPWCSDIEMLVYWS